MNGVFRPRWTPIPVQTGQSFRSKVITARSPRTDNAGVFNAPTALACYAQVFDEEASLDRLADFASRFGPAFYGLPVNAREITLEKSAPEGDEDWPTPHGAVRVFAPSTGLRWRRVPDAA